MMPNPNPSWRKVPPADRIGFLELPSGIQGAYLERLDKEAAELARSRSETLSLYASHPESRDGMVVNGDLIHQLLPSVQENPTLGLAALHEADLETLTHLFQVHHWAEERALDLGEGRPVLLTLGGQASGKTSLANFATGVGAILDAPHSDGVALIKRLTRLMGLKREAWVAWIHRNPVHALQSMLLRSVEEGRGVVLDQMARAHYASPGAFQAVSRAFRAQPRVHLYHVMNLGTPEDILVTGGRLDREGKDATEVLNHLPPWSEQDFRTCLVDGFRNAVAGVDGWDLTPLPRDQVAFLTSYMSREEAVGPNTPPPRLMLDATSPAEKPEALATTLTTAPIDGCKGPEMLTAALQAGIARNKIWIRDAFRETYGHLGRAGCLQ